MRPESLHGRPTARHFDTLRLLVEDNSPEQVAAKLGVGVATVRCYVARVREDYSVKHTEAAVARCLAEGMIPLPNGRTAVPTALWDQMTELLDAVKTAENFDLPDLNARAYRLARAISVDASIQRQSERTDGRTA